MVAIAQLVEPQIVVLVVAGSSPVGHPIYFSLIFKALSGATIQETGAKAQ